MVFYSPFEFPLKEQQGRLCFVKVSRSRVFAKELRAAVMPILAFNSSMFSDFIFIFFFSA